MQARSAQAPARPRRERAENAARRRRQLIEATLSSIEKHGLGGTTLGTVAREAGLSQGVALFYFQTKQALLEATLRQLYEEYRDGWQAALAAAGPDPAERVAALVRAEFAPAICSERALTVWLAFWGEAGARPLYAEISRAFDAEQAAAMRAAVAELAGDGAAAGQLAAGIVAATDGLWMHLHLTEGFGRAEALATMGRMLTALFPGHAARIAPAFPELGDD